MEEVLEVTTPIYDDLQNKMIYKWMRLFFVFQLVGLLCVVLGEIKPLSNISSWLSLPGALGIAAAAFGLSKVNPRYRKAAIFLFIYVGGVALIKLLSWSYLALAMPIISLIGAYQLYNAHSEITAQLDSKLSRHWHNLFLVEIIAGVLSGLFTTSGTTIAVLANVDADVITTYVLIFTALIGGVVELIELIYLKRTQALFVL